MPPRVNKQFHFLPDGYEVTEDGKIYSTKSNWRNLGRREMSQFPNSYGYMSVNLTHNKTKVKRMVHLLVAYKYLPPKPSSMHQIRHLDGNKLNNCASNLKWGTALENADDRDRHGNTKRGQNHHSSKLSDQQRKEIIYDSELNQRKLAEKYKVEQTTISYVRKNAVPILISENIKLSNNINVLSEALDKINKVVEMYLTNTEKYPDFKMTNESTITEYFREANLTAKQALNNIS